jgi:hypothetical protein
MDQTLSKDHAAARRKFLADCGKFAAVTPPVVALLLSAESRKYAVAGSGNNGNGNGGGDGVPGNSNKQDITR